MIRLRSSSRGPFRAVAVLALTAALYGCGGGTGAPPEAGEARGYVPDLTGARVIVFPVQTISSLTGDPEAELVFALESRAPEVDWVMPAELRRSAAGSPGYDVIVDDLPVRVFEQAEVRRIGDPLYGYIRRLAALVDAEAALIPVSVRYRVPPPDTVAAAGEAEGSPEPDTSAIPEPGRAEVTAALVAVVTGRVIWSGVVAGAAGAPSDPAVLASALDALGRAMGPPTLH